MCHSGFSRDDPSQETGHNTEVGRAYHIFDLPRNIRTEVTEPPLDELIELKLDSLEDIFLSSILKDV